MQTMSIASPPKGADQRTSRDFDSRNEPLTVDLFKVGEELIAHRPVSWPCRLGHGVINQALYSGNAAVERDFTSANTRLTFALSLCVKHQRAIAMTSNAAYMTFLRFVMAILIHLHPFALLRRAAALSCKNLRERNENHMLAKGPTPQFLMCKSSANTVETMCAPPPRLATRQLRR